MMILFALLLASQAAPAATSAGQTDSEAAVIANCDAHKFETIVHTTVAGKPHSSKVKLCGKLGQTDAEWLRTLKDAADKVAVNPGMSAEAKAQVIAALNIEIAILTPGGQPGAPQTAILAAPSIGEPSANIRAPIIAPTLGGPVEYSVLPPMPAPQPAVSANVPHALVPSLPAPRMTFRCLATDRLGSEGPCDLLERSTLVTVRADENLPGGTSLRFLRRGDDRGEIELPVLRNGQSWRFGLPQKLCSGVSGSRVEIQIVRTAKGTPQVVDTRGPFELRC